MSNYGAVPKRRRSVSHMGLTITLCLAIVAIAFVQPLALIPVGALLCIAYVIHLVLGVATKELVIPVAADILDYRERQKRIYNDLPELGKARVDKRNAQLAKVGTATGFGIWAIILGAINPIVWPGAIWLAFRAVREHWKDYDAKIQAADERTRRAFDR